MQFGEVMKKFFSIFLTIIFAVCLYCTLVLSVVRSTVNASALSNFAKNALKPVSKVQKIHNDGLFYPGESQIILSAYDDFDFSDLDLSDLSNLDLNTIVNSYLKTYDVDVDAEFVSEILKSPETQQFIEKYVDEIVSYATGTKDKLEIDADDVISVVNNAIDIYEKETGEKVDRSGLEEYIRDGVEQAVTEMSDAIESVREDNELIFLAIKVCQFFLSPLFFAYCIGICVILAVVIFVINLNLFSWFKYISIPSIVDGALMFLPGVCAGIVFPSVMHFLVREFNLPGGISEGILSVVQKAFNIMKIEGAVCIIIGVALCIFGFSLGKKTEEAETQETQELSE